MVRGMRGLLAAIVVALLSHMAVAQDIRSERILKDWEFRRDHQIGMSEGWEKVTVPHDWAIYGPFDRSNDLQTVAVTQNGESVATEKTGRTGGLPYIGKGAYRRSLDITPGTLDGRRHILMFDGAMSEAQVFVKGQKVCFWPYGYNSFWCDVTEYLTEGKNDIWVLLENRPQSSRWYPGAGLYRKVRHVVLPKIHIPIWGTYVTTPSVSEDHASVTVRARVEGLEDGTPVTVRTFIRDAQGNIAAERTDTRKLFKGEVEQQLSVDAPKLWSPEQPDLYYAETEIYAGSSVDTDWSGPRPAISIKEGHILLDKASTRFGIRSIEIIPDKGFFLNGKMRKFQGVCMHHDLGPLGAAINKAALRRQLTILKDMGCDAIRTSHNMPAEELIELCDEMGFMVMLENFDEWDAAKCNNGYHRFFNEYSGDGTIWAEKDMINMLRHFRNNASVVMWSIGNEVPSQWAEGGLEVAAWLQDICHREDPTRPMTCGMDQFDAVLGNGFAGQLDVAGFNYKVDRYLQAYSLLPQAIILGSETASTVSSRGVYHFPVTIGPDILNADHQSSSYDTEHCSWSNIPDNDLAADQDYPWCIGQFVWTGFDYLGEPSPYDTDAWPNHSSVFGIVDLAYIPKDRYYLYRSVWNEEEPTLHILPHWNWKGREGQKTPVYVYTSYPSAELFVNGKSQGIRTKAAPSGETPELGRRAMERFRLMWDDVVYQPGEIQVVAYDQHGVPAMRKTVKTASKATSIKLTPDRTSITADGEDLCFINVSLTDDYGNPVPVDNRLVKVKVKGAGSFKAIANGDPTCLEPFHKPQMHLFSGQLTVIVQSSETPGSITVEVTGRGVKKAETVIHAKEEAQDEQIRMAQRTLDGIFQRYEVKEMTSLNETKSLMGAISALMISDADEVLSLKKKLPIFEKYPENAGTSYLSYDDCICLGIDYTDMYMISGDKAYLAEAESLWQFIEKGIDNNLGGGLYRDPTRKRTKHAFTNASGAVFAAKLYQATENQDYLDMAKGLYLWADEALEDNETALYHESRNLDKSLDDRWSISGTGQMIQAGALLFHITGREGYFEDARRSAEACHRLLSVTGKGNQWEQSMMLRGFIELYKVDGNRQYVDYMENSLTEAWKNRDYRRPLLLQAAAAEMYARLGAI